MAIRTETGEGKARVADFSGGKDGKTEIDVPYFYDFKIYDSKDDVDTDFSSADLVSLANQRSKGTANSGARAKAVAPYAQDPDSFGAVRERMIKDAMKLPKFKDGDKSKAEAFVDSMLA